MLARHVSDLTGPSSGAFCTSCIRRLWYVVLLCVLLDTSSRYEVVGRTLELYNLELVNFDCIISKKVLSMNLETTRLREVDRGIGGKIN